MQVSKKEGKTLNKALEQWSERGLISAEDEQKLRESYQVSTFDWQRAAQYSFWLAIFSILIAFFSALADEWLMELVEKLFNATEATKCISMVVIAALLYTWGIRRKNITPEKVFSNEAIFFLGVVATAISIYFFGGALETESDDFSMLLLLGVIIYGALGLWFPSKLVWIFCLVSLASWFGARTGYVSGWGAYYLGMNYPVRFVLFGLVLIFAGNFVFTQWQSRSEFLRPTRAVGLLYLFIALWLMSIFGNYGDVDSWERARQIELFHWSLLFGLAAIGAIWHGIKFDDGMTRGFGITFIFINLYTRFFEYFWDGTHKAIFFAILGISFWYLGSRAEQIWHLNMLGLNKKPNQD